MLECRFSVLKKTVLLQSPQSKIVARDKYDLQMPNNVKRNKIQPIKVNIRIPADHKMAQICYQNGKWFLRDQSNTSYRTEEIGRTLSLIE